MDQHHRTRNPFDVMDVPNPSDQEVLDFATGAKLAGTSDDENAKAWVVPRPPLWFGESAALFRAKMRFSRRRRHFSSIGPQLSTINPAERPRPP
jgi:hypothetical protein